MKSLGLGFIVAAAGLALGGCASMSTLSPDKLSETASAVTGKSIAQVTNIRSVGDEQYFDAVASDGTVYACQLQVVFGVTFQHQQCTKKQ